MSSRIGRLIVPAVALLLVIGCGGARKQVPVTTEPVEGEPQVTMGDISAISSGPTQLTFQSSNNGLGTYHPNGQSVTFQSDRDGRWQIYKLDLTNRNEEALFVSPSNDENPVWMPDSSGLLFVSDRNGNGNEFARDIFFFDPASAQVATLVEDAADDWYPVPISSDAYLFISERASAPSNEAFALQNAIYRSTMDGSAPVLVAGADVDPCAPTDLGDWRLLIRTQEGRLAILASDGSVRIVTPSNIMCGTASYSASRGLVALNAREGETEYGLYLFDMTANKLQKIDTGSGEIRFPQFSPDGNRILYTKMADGQFQLFQLELAQ